MEAVADTLANIIRRFRLGEIKAETPEENAKRQEEYARKQSIEYYRNEDKRFLKKRSLFNQENALVNEYKDIDKNSPETFRELTKRSMSIVRDFANKNLYTVILTGKAGTGKTMLTSCMLNKLNQETYLRCLFVSVPAMYDLVMSKFSKDSDKNIEKKQERLYHLMNDIKEADVIALDDLGSETSLKSEVVEANQTFQDTLFKIGEIIQTKGLIISTNNSSSDFQEMYNPKITSRLLTKNPAHIFSFPENLEDKRIARR